MVPLPFLTPNESSAMFGLDIERIGTLSAGTFPGLDVICDGIMNGTPFVYPAERIEDAVR